MKKIILFFSMLVIMTGFIFAGELDDLLFSMLKEEVKQYGKQTHLLEEANKSEGFVKKISDSLVDLLGVKDKGYVFDKILEDEDNFLVVYRKVAESYKSLNDDTIVIKQNDGNLFILLINKKECSVDAALYF